VQLGLFAELIDVVLGDQSPLCDVSYVKGDRRRCPSSYAAVWTVADGSSSAAARNIPDWTDLLEAVVSLVCSLRTPSMVRAAEDIFAGRIDFSTPLTLQSGPQESLLLTGLPLECAASPTLLNILLKQQRYTSSACRLVQHLAYENMDYSNAVCEALLTALSMATVEGTGHLFEVAESLLRIEDSLTSKRAGVVLSPVQGVTETLRSWKDDASKHRIVCCCIRALVVLVHRCPSAKEQLCSPLSRVPAWASWMVRFTHSFHARCVTEAGGVAASAPVITASSSSVAGAGAGAGSTPVVGASEATTNFTSLFTITSRSAPFNKGDFVTLLGEAAGHGPSMVQVKHIVTQETGVVARDRLAPFEAFKDIVAFAASMLPPGGIGGAAASVATVETSAPPAAPPAPAAPVLVSSVAAAKGSYIALYGEEPHERELTWVMRSEATKDVLHALLLDVGADADLFAAEAVSSLAEPSHASDAVASLGNSAATSINPFGTLTSDDELPPLINPDGTLSAAANGDHMTDEQFEAFLLSLK
jgi:hypothetical protein